MLGFHYPPSPDRPTAYLGHLLIVTRRHADQWSDPTDDEGARIGVVAARLTRALRERHDATRVYTAVIGHVPHFHLHLLPRYPETPAEVRWTDVDEWEGARRGGSDEIAALVARLIE